MNKLLVICGPTATGKTSLALHLAKELDGELVSADSRQVYKGMDIGTGKDLPKGVKIWGYDLISPKKEFSVAQYVKEAKAIIDSIWKRGKLPILVGGTGLYIKSVVDGIPTISVPKNKSLRRSLEKRSAKELFETLAQIDAIKAASMNYSDKRNPRRLIRAIEIAQWQLKKGRRKIFKKSIPKEEIPTLMIGLRTKKKFLYKKIEQRVEARVRAGIEEEIRALLKSGVSWKHQSMDSLGYKQWKDFFEGKKKKEQIIKKWEKEECKYTKRQMTWFKRDRRINWFDINKKGWKGDIEKLAKKWYKD